MAVYGDGEFNRSIHNIENAPFRTKFDADTHEMKGKLGIGCISDYEPQPLLVRSHHGTYAIATISKINNTNELTKELFDETNAHFLEMSGGEINATELVAALINQKSNLIEGISYALSRIDGCLSILLMTPDGIYCAKRSQGTHAGRNRSQGWIILRVVRKLRIQESWNTATTKSWDREKSWCLRIRTALHW